MGKKGNKMYDEQTLLYKLGTMKFNVSLCHFFSCPFWRKSFHATATYGRILNIKGHTSIYFIQTTQTSREGSNSTKHERRPPEDGQTIATETCRVLMMRFTNIFNNLVF